MQKLYYFNISSHLTRHKAYLLRMAVQRDSFDTLVDHYFEYGTILHDRLALGDSLWSCDPDALVDQMPPVNRFHASMDVRQFLRTDLDDALDGSLMTDEFEILLDEAGIAIARDPSSRPVAARAFA